MPYTPSLIQTILSVPESHRFLRLTPLADYTAGGEFRPAPKTNDPVVFAFYDTTNGDKRQEVFAKSFAPVGKQVIL